MGRRSIVAILIFLAANFLTASGAVSSPAHIWAGPAQPARYQEARRLMWTKFEIVAYGDDRARLAEAAEAAFEEIDRLDRQLSHYAETSDLSHINRNAARAPVIVEKELFDLLRLALDYSRMSDGAFDITVGPLMKAWGFFRGRGRVPGDDELKAAMASVGYRHVRLEARERTVQFDRDGVELDLGGLAKGYAVDRAAEILRRSGVTSALITSGTSSIGAVGAPPNQAAWRVEISDPLERSRQVGTLELKDQSVSTSGCGEKNFELGGKTYCHIMDPRTGRPIEEVVSATVVTPRGVDAEAFSKIVMVLGVDKAKELLKARPDVRAILHVRRPDGGLRAVRLNF